MNKYLRSWIGAVGVLGSLFVGFGLDPSKPWEPTNWSVVAPWLACGLPFLALLLTMREVRLWLSMSAACIFLIYESPIASLGHGETEWLGFVFLSAAISLICFVVAQMIVKAAEARKAEGG
jgi:hypothetical protein